MATRLFGQNGRRWACERSLPLLAISAATFVISCGDAGENASVASTQSAVTLRVPGLVMGLRHNQNQTVPGTVMFSAYSWDATHQDGGDIGAPLHRGYEWWSLRDPVPALDPASFASSLPSGVVVALKHSSNQASQSITAFGRDPVTGPASFTGFQRQNGGDRGASSGTGYYWYESTGVGFTNWAGIDSILPKYTVVGLKHSQNQSSKRLVWNGITYDPVSTAPAPPGFVRVVGGDLGAPAGQGYYWYEKVTGEEIATIPSLRYPLGRTPFMGYSDSGYQDRDRDCLLDSYEESLASMLRPLAVFNSSEHARRADEPQVVYRIYPTSASTLRLRWVFLFANDGGYDSGLCSGFNDHPGDDDTADFDLSTYDGGLSFYLTKITVSFKGLNWPGNNRLEVYQKSYPMIYMSGSKHHEYFTRDNDTHDSPYSDPCFLCDPCDDNVDGRGPSVLVNPFTINGHNNVGEPLAHPYPFADVLAMYDNHTVWNGDAFYSSDAGSVGSKFTDPGLPAANPVCFGSSCSHNVCDQGAPLSSGCSAEAAQICSVDPYCCSTYWDGICVSEVPSGC